MQHAPPPAFNIEPSSGASWKNLVKALPGIPKIRRWLWTPQWLRVVMNERCRALVEGLGPERLEVLEVSGNEWRRLYPFKSYTSVDYPDYDICAGALAQTFDLVIAEQVFEHLLWPYRAARNVYSMLRPGGHFLVCTPFLVKVHAHPVDCSRWTELGLKHLLAECGFPIEQIRTESWGNRACVKGNWKAWTRHHWWRSLKNEPDFPCVVWALARKG